jgi:prevent-host-death family protein
MLQVEEKRVSLAEARKKLGDLIAEVRFGSENIIITKNNKDAVALVSMEEYQLLSDMRNLRELDEARALYAQAQREGTISHEDVVRELLP